MAYTQRTHQNLRQIEWMLAGRGPERADYVPDYGDLNLLNQGGLILTGEPGKEGEGGAG